MVNPAASFKLGIGKASPEELESLSKQAKSLSNVNITLRRAAQTGNLQKIREAHAAGADLNSHDHGEELEEVTSTQSTTVLVGSTSSKQTESTTELPSIELSTLKTNAEKESTLSSNAEKESTLASNDEKAEKTKARLDASKKATSDAGKLNTGDTPLHYACENNFLEAADLLLLLGANIESQNRIGSTPLHRAISFKRESIVEKLLKFSANVGAKNKIGNNSVHIAMYMNYIPVLRLILANGGLALLKVKNVAGMLPTDYAHSTTLIELVKFFPSLRETMHQSNKLEKVDE